MSEIDQAIELPPTAAGWLKEYNKLKEQISLLTEKADIARAHVELAMAENTLATINGVPALNWSYVESNRFDQKKAKEILTADQIEQCMVVQRTRSFRPLSPGEM